MSFKANSFVSDVKTRIQSARKDLEWLLLAYNWARANETAIVKYDPSYTHGWMQSQMTQIFGINIEVVLRFCVRFGGDNSDEAVARGIRIVSRIGSWECVQAEKKLTAEGFDRLVEELSCETSQEEFRKLVHKIYEKEEEERVEKRIKADAKLYSQRNAYKKSPEIVEKQNYYVVPNKEVSERDKEIARLKKLLAEKEAEIARLRAALAAVAEATQKVGC